MSRLIYLAIFSFLIFFVVRTGRAADNYFIQSNIRLNICGDLVAEFPEDCDNTDLNHQTCQLLGLTGGQLSCDVACDFETINCIGTPTPTPAPTSTPTSTPTTPTPAPTSTPRLTPTATPTLNPILTPTIIPTPTSILPSPLTNFDQDKDGHINVTEVVTVVKTWLNHWNNHLENNIDSSLKICDINSDQTCNLTDLSILLYYIGK